MFKYLSRVISTPIAIIIIVISLAILIGGVFAYQYFFVKQISTAVDWSGNYEFVEVAPGLPDSGQPNMIESYNLALQEDTQTDGYIAKINIDGFQNLQRLIGVGELNNSKLTIVFNSYGSPDSMKLYKTGDVLFVLEFVDQNKLKIVWEKIQPNFEITDKNNSFFVKSNSHVDETAGWQGTFSSPGGEQRVVLERLDSSSVKLTVTGSVVRHNEPSCSFTGTGKVSSNTLTIALDNSQYGEEGKDAKVFAKLSADKNQLTIESNSFDYRFVLMRFCFGGGSIGGTYTYTSASVDTNPTPIYPEISDWKTYTNTKYGFEFKYPKELENINTLKEFPTDCSSASQDFFYKNYGSFPLFESGGSEGNMTAEILCLNDNLGGENNSTLISYLQKNVEEEKYGMMTFSGFQKIDVGVNNYKFSTFSLGHQDTHIQISIGDNLDNLILIISFDYYPNIHKNGNAISPNLDKILSTFKFLKQ